LSTAKAHNTSLKLAAPIGSSTKIAPIQPHDARVAAEEFQVWKLVVRPDRNATLVCEDGNDNVVFSKEITFLLEPNAIDATNWRAEHTVRPAVVTRKVCGDPAVPTRKKSSRLSFARSSNASST
jgi:hypothetical protein